MKLIKKRRNDEHFEEVVNDFESFLFKNKIIKYDLFYFPFFDDACLNTIFEQQESNIVIIFQHDNMEINTYQQLINKMLINSDKKYVFFSSQLKTINFKNIFILNWGSCWLLERNARNLLTPVLEKDVKNKKHWISLNLVSHAHRILAGMIIKSLGLDNYGFLRLSMYPLANIDSWQKYFTFPKNEKYNSLLTDGFNKLKKHDYVTPDYFEIYNKNILAPNVNNFNEHLREFYKKVYVEIVNETTYDVIGIHVTEKFMNSVFGMNIPIINGPCGLVSYLESVGFDMLRDVVDHSYDDISDPFERGVMLITLNKRLLSDTQYVEECYNACYERLYNNYEVAVNLSNIIKNQLKAEYPNVINFLQR